MINATDAVLITEAEPIDDPGPRIIYVNPAFCRMTGYSSDDVIGRSPRILQGPDSCPSTISLIQASLKAWKPIEAEVLNYRKDGSTFWVELSISLVTDETGWHTHWISIQRDVTERRLRQSAAKQLELTSLHNHALSVEIREREIIQDRLSYVAFHDSLTGLHNRTFFMDALRAAFVRVQQGEARGLSVVVYLDLDGFKGINDTLGHRVGDELLIETGRRLKSCARASDTLAQMGGDEFTFLFEGLEDLREAQEIAERILEATQAQLLLASTVFQIAPSIGICPIQSSSADAEAILRDADLAMYAAKRAGGENGSSMDRRCMRRH
ncbi:sensor domain-containing protein [Granulicella arctica]|uniref:sensor domain-containing protein n=1 Tax=Granulicella arctica TaxID=940613 RepID=UPI0021DFC9F6|nr:diguanylate cyclase [Granulicella arctica]